jgi:hypothetical protein
MGATLLRMRTGWTIARGLVVASVLSCTNPIKTRRPPDASVVLPDSLAVLPDVPPTPDLPTPADSMQATDAGLRCAPQTVASSLIPVRGTVQGPTVEGEICDHGVGTFFLGPEDIAPTYDQDFFTNTWLDAPYSPTGYDGSQVYGFLMRKPAGALSAELRGWVGAAVAEVGAYDSASNCGFLDFEVTLPIPPGVYCTRELAPCDPGCEGVGEMWVCEPANPKLHYSARPSAVCGAGQDPAVGGWNLTLTAVSAYVPNDTYLHHVTHGNLTATLVNQADPSDSLLLNLAF